MQRFLSSALKNLIFDVANILLYMYMYIVPKLHIPEEKSKKLLVKCNIIKYTTEQ